MTRLEHEAEFHDQAFTEGTRAAASKFYAVSIASRRYYRDLIVRDVAGRDVLEYGCGRGSAAFEIARAGGRVIGIDISTVGIAQATTRAEAEGVEARFERMDAEHLSFADARFDLIVGSGILHHLDMARAFAEVARVLRPGGRAIFYEPLGHNPAINWYRRHTPDMRTADEHPLVMGDLDAAARWFEVRTRYHHLTSLALVPLRRTRLFRPLYAVTETIDRLLFLMPLRRWAWCAVIELRPFSGRHAYPIS